MTRRIYISIAPLCHWLRTTLGDVIPPRFFTSISQKKEDYPSASWGKTLRWRCRCRQVKVQCRTRILLGPMDMGRPATCYTGNTFPPLGPFLCYSLRLLPSPHCPLFYSSIVFNLDVTSERMPSSSSPTHLYIQNSSVHHILVITSVITLSNFLLQC